MYHMTIKSNEFNVSVLKPHSKTLQKSNHKKRKSLLGHMYMLDSRQNAFFLIFYLTRNELNFSPGHSSSAPTCGENVSCRSSQASGTLHTFQIIFCDNFQFLFFMFCNVSAFLLIHQHSQSSVLTEFKRLFLVRHRSSCRPIGRVEIWTANQS